MNLLMINPVIRPNEKPMCIPHGLALLANMIRNKFKDINITFLDINGYRYDEQTVKQIIRTTDFDVVFIGGLIPVYKQVIDLSEYIKIVDPNATIVAGGSVAMSVPKELLTHSDVDIICTGEGEVTSIEIIKYLKNNNSELKGLPKVKGIAYLNNSKFIQTEPQPYIQDLDTESMLPAYDMLPMDIYTNINVLGMGKEIDFVTSRGCPFRCSFCVTKDTRITTRSHTKYITDIKVDEVIKGYDIITNKIVDTKVEKLHQRIGTVYKIELTDGTKLNISNEHPVYTKRGWIKVKDLTEEDELLKVD